MYSGQVEGSSGLFINSIDTDTITANIGGSNYDHTSCVEDELLFNCDHKSCIDDELLSNCDTKENVNEEIILIVTQRRRLIMKLVLIVTLVWLKMNLSG